MDYLFGLFRPGLLGYVLITAAMCHLTVVAVTVFLHREQAHRALDLHPAVRMFFRFWLWLTTGIVTREWVAVHRKHHAHCETEDDPHSPQVLGLRKVLLEGAELYRAETARPETLEKYGRGTPDDWIERRLFTPYSYMGVVLMAIIDLLAFGVVGITIFAIQMMTIPVLAAGIVNGVGHHSGYRNFECDDAATNIVPIGVVLGGEELHNNHHAFPTSARFSVRRWEFDIGWMYISLLSAFGLARVRKLTPRPHIEPGRPVVDLDTLRAVLINRMHVLRDYSRRVTLPTLQNEFGERLSRNVRRLMIRQPSLLDAGAQRRLQEMLEHHRPLRTVHEFRERLQALWRSRTLSNEKLLEDLRDWLTQAEGSGVRALQDFAARLRSYSMQPALTSAPR